MSAELRAQRNHYQSEGHRSGIKETFAPITSSSDAARQILSAEELGLCARGGGGAWVREGGGEMTSRLPVNPSGGLLSKGEPLGASALAQAIEIVWQLRGSCGPRQVPEARVGLAHTAGRGANACVMIFRR